MTGGLRLVVLVYRGQIDQASLIAYQSYADMDISSPKITPYTKLPLSFCVMLCVMLTSCRLGHWIVVNEVPWPTPLWSPQPPIITANGGHFTFKLLPLVPSLACQYNLVWGGMLGQSIIGLGVVFRLAVVCSHCGFVAGNAEQDCHQYMTFLMLGVITLVVVELSVLVI